VWECGGGGFVHFRASRDGVRSRSVVSRRRLGEARRSEVMIEVWTGLVLLLVATRCGLRCGLKLLCVSGKCRKTRSERKCYKEATSAAVIRSRSWNGRRRMVAGRGCASVRGRVLALAALGYLDAHFGCHSRISAPQHHMAPDRPAYNILLPIHHSHCYGNNGGDEMELALYRQQVRP
jgi:hypothetical protein